MENPTNEIDTRCGVSGLIGPVFPPNSNWLYVVEFQLAITPAEMLPRTRWDCSNEFQGLLSPLLLIDPLLNSNCITVLFTVGLYLLSISLIVDLPLGQYLFSIDPIVGLTVGQCATTAPIVTYLHVCRIPILAWNQHNPTNQAQPSAYIPSLGLIWNHRPFDT